MGIIQTVKNLFKRGGYIVTGQSLSTLNDHPKINIDPKELLRIDNGFRLYRNEYDKVEYTNSAGDSSKRDYIALNMVKTTSEMMAGLVLNENATIQVDGKADEFIQEVFQHNDFKLNLIKYLEPMFAVGGIAARPYVDTNTNKVEFSWALANAFYPLKSTSNGISEAVIVFKSFDIEKDKQVFYTLLEFHEWDKNSIKITNELYRSNNSNEVGERVPLGTGGQYDGVEETTVLENMTRPLFNYLKPSGFNNLSLYSPLGVGICDNALTTLKQINDTYDQFNWEIQMGQRTVAVSDAMLNYVPDESGNVMKPVFDASVNVYKALRMDQDDSFVKDLTHDIRTEQYISAINQFMKTLEMQTQLSVGTFSFDGKSFKTATEVVSENTQTYRTRNMQCNEVERFIKGLIISVLELSSAYGLYSGEIPTEDKISVDFDDGIFTSKESQLEYNNKAVVGQLMPRTEAIKRQFGLTDKEAVKWYDTIKAELQGLDVTELVVNNETKEIGEEE